MESPTTPKVGASTTLNGKAEARHPAPGTKSLAQILMDLRQAVPARLISQNYHKGDYIHHAVVRDLLDYYAPGWSSRVRVQDFEGKIYVTVSLTLAGLDDEPTITREGIGNEDDTLGDKDYGDSSSNAHAQALRRAAMEFGLGRNLWRKKVTRT